MGRITVIIPSYERQDFLLRQMAYWGGEAASVVIVDGSRESLSGDILEALSTQPNIEYLHRPTDIASRLRVASGHIHTPYAVTLGDDEFHLKSGLSRAIEKLEIDHSLVACIGQSLTFGPSRDGTFVRWGAGYSHWRYEVTQDDARGRLISAMPNYNAATCYAVLREPFWSRSWGTLQRWSSPYAAELQQAIATYVFGKLSTVDEVYWLRSSENAPISNRKESNRKLRFHDWWSLPLYESERQEFVAILAAEVVASTRVGQGEAQSVIREGVEAYIQLGRRTSTAMSPVASLTWWLRVLVGRALKRVVSEELFLRLRASTVRLLRMQDEGNYGSLEDLIRLKSAGRLTMSSELLSELSDIETMISGFYRARRGET